MTKINQFKKLGNTLISKGRWFLVHAFKVKPETINRQYLEMLIGGKTGILKDKIWHADETYFYTTLETIKDILKYDLVDEREYLSEKFDCDDFAEVINARFRSIYGINTVGVARHIEGIDVDTGKHLFWHRANVFIAKENNTLEVYCLEPQTDQIVKLKSNEAIFGSRKYILNTIDF